jgi:hypothetical protein
MCGSPTTRLGHGAPGAAACPSSGSWAVALVPAHGPGSCCSRRRAGSFEHQCWCSGWWGRVGPPSPKGARAALPHHLGARVGGPAGSAGRRPAQPPEPGRPRAGLSEGAAVTGAACGGQGAEGGRVGVGAWRVEPGAAQALAGRGNVRSRPCGTAATVPHVGASKVGFGQGRARRARHGWALSAAAGASSLVGWGTCRPGSRGSSRLAWRQDGLWPSTRLKLQERRRPLERYPPASSRQRARQPLDAWRRYRGRSPRTSQEGCRAATRTGLRSRATAWPGGDLEQVRRGRAGPTELPTVRTPPAMPHTTGAWGGSDR